MTVPGNLSSPLLATATGAAAAAEYVIPKSLRFNSGDTSYLDKTFSSAGNRKTFTFSCWLKRAKLGVRQFIFEAGSTDNATDRFMIRFQADDTLIVTVGGAANRQTSQVFRDVGAWANLIVAVDTTASTANDRIKIYWNGSQIADFSSTSNPSQNANTGVSSAAAHSIGKTHIDNSNYFDGELADIQLVDGQALAPTDFGETRSSDGVWVPKEASFTSPNDGTVWSSNNTGNTNSGLGWDQAFNGLGPAGSTGYVETSSGSGSTVTINVPFTKLEFAGNGSGFQFNGTTVSHGGAYTFTDITSLITSPLTTIKVTSASVISAIKVDGVILTDGAGKYGKNGFHLNFSDSSTNEALGFDSAPTTPDPDPKKGMDVITYSGTGSAQNVGGLLFEPGLVWIKPRNVSDHNILYDTVRGPQKQLYSNDTDAQETETQGLKTFNPDGFSLGTGTHTVRGQTNTSGNTYVAWSWKAGGPAVANTDGTITTQVSANTDYGFSIIKYTGVDNSSAQTIGHGLGKVPKWVLIKNLTDGEDWAVYHASVGNTKYLQLNSNAVPATSSAYWNDTDPTSSLITLNNSNDVQRINREYIVYAWSEILGYSKFSSYTGNGSATGPVVTTGFKVKWLLIKSSTVAGAGWYIWDSERDTSNPRDKVLRSDSDGSETSGSGYNINFNDNGFQIVSTADSWNKNGDTFLYMAFADRPGNNWDVNNIVTNEGLTTSRDNFNAVKYTGNGGTQSIDSLAFQPDLVWIKDRSQGSDHALFDSVRGATKRLRSNQTNAEHTDSGYLTSFNSDGFTVGSHAAVNYNNDSFVAWCWKAGGSSNTYNINGTGYSTASAAGVDGGDITPSAVSASTTTGFAIVKYTGNGADNQSIATGLTQKLGFMIIKPLSSGTWFTRNASLAEGEAIILTDDLARNNWDGRPSETLGSGLLKLENGASHNDNVNTNNTDYIAYCFADVPGYQRANKYTGSGASGNTIVTGFRPAFVLIKGSSHGGDWTIYDAARGNDNYLSANKTDAEENFSTKDFTFTNNGFVLEGNDNSVNASGRTYIYFAIGDDEIGSDEDCLVDVPNAVTADADATDTTGGYQRGNYATLNPLNSTATLSNGNLVVDTSAANFSYGLASGFGMSSGKWYFEATVNSVSGTSAAYIGLATSGYFGSTSHAGTTSYGWEYQGYDGSKLHGGSNAAYGDSYTTGDTVACAFDADAGSLTFYKNGTSQGVAYTGLVDGPYFAVFGDNTSGGSAILSVNFGQMRFKYPMPSGYAALNTTAMTPATIPDGSAYFDAVTYTSDNQASKKLTFGFSPDFFWSKVRNFAEHHVLHDSVRGPSKVLKSSSNAAETTEASGRGVLSFDSDGVTIGIGSPYNSSGNNSVVWGWNAGANSNKTYTVKVVSDSGNKYRFDDFGTSAVTLDLAEGSTYIFDQSDSSNAGHPIRFGTSANGTDYTTGVTHTGTPGSAGAKTTLVLGTGVATLYYSCANHSGMGGQINTNSTAGASNFDGSLQATVKANPEAGFSIVKVSGPSSAGFQSVGHGLNAKPELIICKDLDNARNWSVYHKDSQISDVRVLPLNQNVATFNSGTATWDISELSTTTFTPYFRDDYGVSFNADNLCLCFAPVAGFSAMGTYEGTGSNVFVHLGFRPRFILHKDIDTAHSWHIFDTARDIDNPVKGRLFPNSNNAENTSNNNLDMLSNGFVARDSNTTTESGKTYVFYAVAENPFQANGGLAR